MTSALRARRHLGGDCGRTAIRIDSPPESRNGLFNAPWLRRASERPRIDCQFPGNPVAWPATGQTTGSSPARIHLETCQMCFGEILSRKATSSFPESGTGAAPSRTI